MKTDITNSGTRKGSRRMGDVPRDVLERLSRGQAETLNLMEWLAADMSVLASALATEVSLPALKRSLSKASTTMVGLGVTGRLAVAGRAIASAVPLQDPDFLMISHHGSDLVRQWAAYAVNDARIQISFEERLAATLPFASDSNMSVREAAWMSFRPHVARDPESALVALAGIADGKDASQRRFAVEVCRPRSVWGAHLPVLKSKPALAEGLLDKVRADPSRYVQLAVGNWINDASKTNADWALALASRWMNAPNADTLRILRRGLRTLLAAGSGQPRDLFRPAWPNELGLLSKQGRLSR